MSWHYLPELAVGSSGLSSAGGVPSAPWRKSRSPENCSSDGNETVCYRCSLSGTISKLSMALHGVDSLISCLRDFLVSLSRSRDDDEVLRTKETFGPIRSASFARWNRGSRSWKTCHTFWPMTISAKCSDRWPKRGTMRNGKLYRLARLGHRTFEKGSGYLPSPRANKGTGLWPTPRTTDGSHGGRVTPRKGRQGGNLVEAVSTGWSTPTATGACLQRQVGGQLNPDWVEWLMGWPIGWTALEPLARDKFQEWWRKHGRD